MPTNRLGMHWIRNHPDNKSDLDFVRRLQPASIKLFGGAWDDWGFCEELRQVLPPDCIILARDHPLSEQKEDMWRDPVGTGRRHANEWNEKVQRSRYWMPVERTYFLGINEPDAVTGDRHAIDLYTVAFLDGLRMHGLKGGAFNFSTGHPRTKNGTNDPADRKDYAFFEASHQAIVRGGHIAIQHIYGTAAEPCVPGNYDALKDCPWQDVTWVIGECGIDEHVVGGGAHVGYLGSLDPHSAYPQWMERLIRGANDPRIHSWQPFTWDFSHPWDSFDARAANDAFLAWGWQGYAPVSQPVTVHLPIVENGVTEDLFPRVMKFINRWEGGYVNNPLDPGGATNRGITIGTLTAWRKAQGLPAPTVEDVKALTQEEADAIYRAWYWQPSGASALSWPDCLAVFDVAVNGGVGRAKQFVDEVGTDALAVTARRLTWYTKIDGWASFGRGWVNRCADLLKEMGKAA